MFAEPTRTPYDLTFRALGFPVRVHPMFWLISALFGSGFSTRVDALFLVLWVLVSFVSILAHELGHALAFRLFRVESHIILYSFGGLAVPSGYVSRSWARIVVALAGPLAGFLLAAAVFGSDQLAPWADTSRATRIVYFITLAVNIYWGLLNLLPVFPLDGSKVCQEICSYFSRRNAEQIALKISIAVGTLFAVYSFVCEMEARQGTGRLDALPWWIPRGSLWTAILFGLLAYQSYLLLQQRRWTDSHWDDRPPWRR